tara:strand:+ start:3551 stop:3868 length:318 start_codon:yes stop_codon:yes gene_type:complete
MNTEQTYYEKNKDERLKYDKEYYEKNKDKIIAYKKEWRLKNKDKQTENKRQWRLKNKDKETLYRVKSAEQKKQKITCECGCVVSRGNLFRHKESQKHLLFLETLQ